MLNFSVTFFITLVNLAVLFIIMRAILFKPVTKFMKARQDAVKADIDNAAKQRADAEKMKADYEAQLATAEGKADKIIADAKITAGKNAEKIVKDAQADAAQMMKAGEARIKAEEQAAAATFQAQASALVLAAAAKLLQREFTSEDSKREAALFLKQLSQQAEG
jgi:F-type H+-transporting ATPase subunit b